MSYLVRLVPSYEPKKQKQKQKQTKQNKAKQTVKKPHLLRFPTGRPVFTIKTVLVV